MCSQEYLERNIEISEKNGESGCATQPRLPKQTRLTKPSIARSERQWLTTLSIHEYYSHEPEFKSCLLFSSLILQSKRKNFQISNFVHLEKTTKLLFPNRHKAKYQPCARHAHQTKKKWASISSLQTLPYHQQRPTTNLAHNPERNPESKGIFPIMPLPLPQSR